MIEKPILETACEIVKEATTTFKATKGDQKDLEK